MVLRHASISRLEAIPLGDGYTFSLTALSDVEHLAAALTAPAEPPSVLDRVRGESAWPTLDPTRSSCSSSSCSPSSRAR